MNSFARYVLLFLFLNSFKIGDGVSTEGLPRLRCYVCRNSGCHNTTDNKFAIDLQTCPISKGAFCWTAIPKNTSAISSKNNSISLNPHRGCGNNNTWPPFSPLDNVTFSIPHGTIEGPRRITCPQQWALQNNGTHGPHGTGNITIPEFDFSSCYFCNDNDGCNSALKLIQKNYLIIAFLYFVILLY